MRLPCGKEDGLARLERHVVEHERAERADVAWELAVQRQHQLPDLLLDACDAAVLVALHEGV